MTISLQDPEALEEVFWKLYTRSSYISEECLVPHDISRECQKGFENYLARIIFSKEHRQGCRYLSKNNNNILRLRSILSLFPEAKAIVPFRHPLSHSNSLLNQHKRFCKLQEKDGFVEEYMTLLGHHEFGRAHKPFFFGSMPMRKSNFPIGGVDYWLNIWNNTYSFLLDTVGDDVIFWSYEGLNAKSKLSLKALCDITDLDYAQLPQISINYSSGTQSGSQPTDRVQMKRSEDLYRTLHSRAINGF